MKNDNQYIEYLIVRYLLAETTKLENQELEAWRQANVDNEQWYQDYRETLEKSTAHLASQQNINIDAEWKRFEHSIDSQSQELRERNVVPFYAQPWLKVAAGIALIAIISLVVIQFTGSDSLQTYYADTSGKQVVLPDGSTITLNTASEIKYSNTYGEDSIRTVSLTGEAFFEVKSNPQQPFVVQLNEATVEVVGTSFNIQAYKNTQDINVVVATGIVRFGSTNNEESVLLKAGDRGTINKNNNQVSQIMNTDVNYLSWKTQQIVFEDVSLDKVIQTLNSLYEANITISAETAVNCKVTVSFDHQSLEAILSVLEETLDLTYIENGDNIEIISTGC